MGRLSTPDGAIYTGQFQHGQKHGKGQLKNMDGEVCIGEFVDDQKHGLGVIESDELPKIHDFQKFVTVFASAGPGAERARSRSPKQS